MKLYYGGDIKSGGFRFLSNGYICIDFVVENAPYDKYIKDICLYINQNHVDKVFIFSLTKEEINLSFLSECEGINEIQISALCENLDVIYRLSPTKLYLQEQDYPIQFDKLHENLVEFTLYNVSGGNRKPCLNEDILGCEKLKSLNVSGCEAKDLAIIMQMSLLEELGIVDCKVKTTKMFDFSNLKFVKTLLLQNVSKSLFSIVKDFPLLTDLWCNQMSIETLSEIGTRNRLRSMHLNYCSKLTDISALEDCQSLEVVEFESCKNIRDLTPLTTLKQLKHLKLFKCGEIPSLSFINEIPSLESIIFTETNVLDGDLSPCMRLKSAWSSTGKKHYNISVDDLPHNPHN